MKKQRSMHWFEQEPLLANIFFYMFPSELFTNNTRLVLKSWNDLLCSNEFCKYYFEKSFCIGNPFVNSGGLPELISHLELATFLKSKVDGSDINECDEFDDDHSYNEGKEPLMVYECIKYLDIRNDVFRVKQLTWKDCFYRKLLSGICFSMRCNERCGDLVEKNIVAPLSEKQRIVLKNKLDNWGLSRLLTLNFRINPRVIFTFRNNGAPLFIRISLGDEKIYLDNVNISQSTEYSTLPEHEMNTLMDVITCFFPPLIELKKKKSVKSPLSSYMMFSQAHRAEFVQNYPRLRITEIAKAIGAKWASLHDSEKLPYVEKAQALKMEYQRNINAFIFTIRGLDESN